MHATSSATCVVGHTARLYVGLLAVKAYMNSSVAVMVLLHCIAKLVACEGGFKPMQCTAMAEGYYICVQGRVARLCYLAG